MDVDTSTKIFMQDKKHFADAFNYIFNGKFTVNHNELISLDPTELAVIISPDNAQAIQKYRDVLKQAILMHDTNATYVILGIENQTNVHYAMAVKSLVYDALNYDKQVNEIATKHKQNKDLKGNEYLSGFTKNDKLKPVITLTIYWGKTNWDAPKSLFEMFETEDPHILNYCNDYKINIIIPKEIKDFSLFTSDLRNVLQMIAVANDKELYRKALTNDESYKHVPAFTANLIKTVAGINITIPQGQKEVNMCIAQELLYQEAIDIGIKQERKNIIINTLKKLGSYQEVADLLGYDIDYIKQVVSETSV